MSGNNRSRVFFLILQTYSESHMYQKDAHNDDEHTPLWFVMDEFGSCIKHSDDPSFAIGILHYVPLGMAFSLLWPLRDMDYGGMLIFMVTYIYEQE